MVSLLWCRRGSRLPLIVMLILLLCVVVEGLKVPGFGLGMGTLAVSRGAVSSRLPARCRSQRLHCECKEHEERAEGRQFFSRIQVWAKCGAHILTRRRLAASLACSKPVCLALRKCWRRKSIDKCFQVIVAYSSFPRLMGSFHMHMRMHSRRAPLHTTGSQMKVSPVGFGTAGLGNVYGNVPRATRIRAVQKALELGINLFDTAPFYGGGESESVLGEALKEASHDHPRSSYYIMTKAGRYGTAASSTRSPAHADASRSRSSSPSSRTANANGGNGNSASGGGGYFDYSRKAVVRGENEIRGCMP